MATLADPLRRKNSIALLILTFSSLLLIFGSVYLLEELSVIYGVGVGAAVQAYGDNSVINSTVATAATNLTTIHYSMLETYIMLAVALGLTAAAFTNERGQVYLTSYVRLNAALVIVYTLLMYLILSESYVNLGGIYIYVAYAGIAICLAADVYLEYSLRQQMQHRPVSSISLDPTKPFSNILAIQDSLFSTMSGNLRIVDKHFNSTALENLHRLTSKSLGSFTEMMVLTSSEMLDSEMGKGVADFRSELARSGIGLEVRLMNESDVVDQHERMILDDSVAYKVPPLNIINRRSEHITRIGYREARRRFDYLYQRGIKIENYFEKQARNGNGGLQ